MFEADKTGIEESIVVFTKSAQQSLQNKNKSKENEVMKSSYKVSHASISSRRSECPTLWSKSQ